MRFSTWLALAALFGLCAHYPQLLGVIDVALELAAWSLGQPFVLAAVLGGIVVHRARVRFG